MVEFFYSYGLVLELLLSLGLFTIHLKRRKFFLLRVLAVIAFLALFCFYRSAVSFNNVFFKIFNYLILYVGCVALGVLVYDEPMKITGFCMVGGVIAQHVSYTLADLVRTILANAGLDSISYGIIYIILIILINVILFLAFALRQNHKDYENIQEGPIIGSSVFLFIVCIVVLQVFEYYRAEISFHGYIIFVVLDTTCCLMIYLIQAVNYFSARKTIETEIMKNRLVQYESLQNVVEVMNIRLHDLKHQVRKLEKNNDINPEALKGLNDTIAKYKTFARVGNETLDTILTEKTIYCEKEKINFTYNINGHLFDAFSLADINSIFGNAFDNAIDYLKTLDEGERFLTIRSSEVGQLAKISFENTYVGKPNFDKYGLLDTTKTNSLYHGFGLMSIKKTVEKYGGNMTITVENKTFKLQLLFPVEKGGNE